MAAKIKGNGTTGGSDTQKSRRQNLLFVCIGNSCRSQMAEAFANRHGNGQIRAWSAGSAPLGYIAEGTEGVMAEKGIFLQGHYSKGVEEIPLPDMDVIVTMGCGMQCPTFPGFQGNHVEWEIPDPYGYGIDRFRQVRDLLESQVLALLKTLPHVTP